MDFIRNLRDKWKTDLERVGLVSLGAGGGGVCSSVDPGVKIDDDVDGSHDDFCCDENNDCDGAKSKQSCES